MRKPGLPDFNMLKNRLFYLVGLIGALAFHTFYTGWFSWFLLLLVVILPIFSLIISLPSMLRTSPEITIPQKVLRGQVTLIHISAETKRILPAATLRFRLVISDQMEADTVTYHCLLHADETNAIPVSTEHCGAFSVEAGRGRVYDLLGLIWLPMELPACGGFLVMPTEKQPKELPLLSQVLARSFHPKLGGGYSEIHDLREYRAGDNLHSVHWKLSAKTDDLLVREPMEADTGFLLLTLDLAKPRERLDRSLSELLWLSGWLIEKEISHRVLWLDGTSHETDCSDITEKSQLDDLIVQLLQSRISDEGTSLAARSFPEACWHYHIGQGDTV